MFAPSIALDAQHTEYIHELKHVFVEAQNLTAVPWQLLAGIWYRESFSVAPPLTPGGPMQFDPPLTSDQIEHLLKVHTHLDVNQIPYYSKKGINNFSTAVLCAACFLKEKMHGGFIQTDDEVKQAIWHYNGAVGKHPEESAYVYNGFDKDHFHMRIKGTIPNGKGKRIKIDVEDKRPGAFTVYKQLLALGL